MLVPAKETPWRRVGLGYVYERSPSPSPDLWKDAQIVD